MSAGPTLPYRWPSSVALASIVMLCLEISAACLRRSACRCSLDLLQLDLVLLDHPLVMVVGDRGQALRNQIVVGVAGLHLDDLPLLADVLDRVDQQQLDAAARTDAATGGRESWVCDGAWVVEFGMASLRYVRRGCRRSAADRRRASIVPVRRMVVEIRRRRHRHRSCGRSSDHRRHCVRPGRLRRGRRASASVRR